MNFPFWISRKLKLNAANHGANTTGVVIAVTGVTLAIVIMLLTIAIVLGFKHQVTQRVMGFNGELWVLPDYKYSEASSASTLAIDSIISNNIQTVVPGATTSLQFNQPGLLKTDNDFAGVYFTGYDSGHNYTFEKANIIEGELPDFSDPENSNRIVISSMTGKALGLELGDKINACFFVNEAIKARKFEIAGIYESGFGDYDRTIVYAPINTLQRIADVDSTQGTKLSVILPLSEKDHIEEAAEALQEIFLEQYRTQQIDKLYPVDNVKHTGAIYFNWLSLLDTNVIVIFILMICVSGFTLISSMFILILERIPTIGILRALGATRRQIRWIFIFLTMKIVGIGIISGNVLGLSLIWLQNKFNIVTLDPDMYYLRYVPAEFNLEYTLYLNLGVALVSWLILIMPSRVASHISPAVTMRFE